MTLAKSKFLKRGGQPDEVGQTQVFPPASDFVLFRVEILKEVNRYRIGSGLEKSGNALQIS